MAAKKNGDSKSTMSKTAFVVSQPASLGADEVVAKATEQGISLTKEYVHTIRSKAGLTKRGRKRGRPRERAANAGASAATTSTAIPRARGQSGRGSLESQFTALVAEIGLARAEELLRSVRAKFKSVARG